MSASPPGDNPYAAPAAAGTPPGEDGPRRGSLLVIFLTVFIDLLGFGMVLPLLPIYAKQFETDESGWEIGLLMASFSIMQFIFAPLWGRLSDRIGRRPVLMVGLLGSVVFYALFGWASIQESLFLLFVSRIGAGIAGATISTAHAYIADTTSLQGRTKGMALIGAAFGLGFTFGPLFAALAMWRNPDTPGPGPGFAAAALSAVALLLAIFILPESLPPGKTPERRRRFSFDALSEAMARPSIGLLLLTSFVAVVAFGSFESTLSLFIKNEDGPFEFTFRQVCYTFAYIGIVLAVVQGGIVRRVADRNERSLATFGIVVLIAGLALLAIAEDVGRLWLLLVALAVCVTGFAFITPSLNSLISRRSDPAKQGSIMGLAQSVSSLARIVGPIVGIRLFYNSPTLPLWVGTGLMGVALVLLWIAVSRGGDFPEAQA